jgi:hypothetical protein
MSTENSSQSSNSGVGCTALIGIVLAALISWNMWHSVFWALVAGFFGWFYVIYPLFAFGWPVFK